MMELLQNLFQDYTLRTVALGSGILGIVSGILGSFAVLRKQSLLGDAISHAALPGIAMAFLLTLSKSTLILTLGAALAGWLGTWLVIQIVQLTRIKMDSALGLVLSVFFGFGLVLLTYIQKKPYANQAGLDTFLFGQAAALLERDVLNMAILSGIILCLLALFWKELKLLSFDPDFASSLGFAVGRLNILLTSMLVVAIVVGLQTVGVVLMSAMVVAPAAAARQWTDRLGIMVILAGIFGAFAGISGALVSSSFAQMPTGPTIVVSISGVVGLSILIAPNRGIIWRWLRERSNRQKLQIDAVLDDLYILARQHDHWEHGHGIQVLRAMSVGHGGVDRTLRELQRRGWVKKTAEGNWALTEIGWKEAKKRNGQEEAIS
ncbi:MAG: iron chelate uptake ABC transporter family permease subunit [Calditrichia bacterium]